MTTVDKSGGGGVDKAYILSFHVLRMRRTMAAKKRIPAVTARNPAQHRVGQQKEVHAHRHSTQPHQKTIWSRSALSICPKNCKKKKGKRKQKTMIVWPGCKQVGLLALDAGVVTEDEPRGVGTTRVDEVEEHVDAAVAWGWVGIAPVLELLRTPVPGGDRW